MLAEELKKIIEGDVETSGETLEKYSHDASIMVVKPEVVVFPKHAKDVEALMHFANENKEKYPTLSLTARGAGTCMAGGSINDSVIIDMNRYMQGILEIKEESATHYGFEMAGVVKMLPGTFYRDLEKATKEKGLIMPTYTASKELCSVGGMVGNNSGGEKTIRYGKVENFIKELKVVFRDGNEYTVKPLTGKELEEKCALKTLEGELYREVRKLLTDNWDEITGARPKVSKNSAGYYLWNIWDKEHDIFDLCRLIVGSQGTLGIVTEITWYLVPIEKYSKLYVIFMKKLYRLGELVDDLLPFKPESIESYDDYSLSLAVKFMPDFLKQMSLWRFIGLGLSFIPEALMMLRGGMPKLVLLVECTGKTEEEVDEKIQAIHKKVSPYGFQTRVTRSEKDAEKYWRIRRESFNLLRKHVKGKHTAPFIDDICVPPHSLPQFLPKLNEILSTYNLVYTIAGHAGNGNFHIIPLMDFSDPKTKGNYFRAFGKSIQTCA
jgi:FAD/FMN-containing dehydrogenase